MKIRFISDIHLNKKPSLAYSFTKYMKYTIKKDCPDILILGGDYFNGKTKKLIDFLKRIEDIVNFHVVFVLGNHDILDKDFNEFCKVLNKTFRKKIIFLENKTVEINGKTIYGSIGFVDWSVANKDIFSYKKIESVRKEFKRVSFNGKHIDAIWMKDYHQECLKTMKRDNPDIIVTHFPLIKEPFLDILNFKILDTSFRTNDNWNFIKTLNTKIFINGHVHARINFKKDNKLFVSNPLDRDDEVRTDFFNLKNS